MKKILILLLAFLLLLPSISFASSNEGEDTNIDIYSEVEQLVLDTLSEKEVELMESFEDNPQVQNMIFENYHYDKNGNMSLEVSNLDKFTKETGLDLETADIYINSINKTLDIVNEKQQTLHSEVTPMSNTRCDYTKEILANFTYESNYCRAATEKLLDNISRNTYILGGIALVGFWNPYVSIASGLGSIFSSLKYDRLNAVFRDSDYTGVINRVVKVPLSPDGSYWRPLGTAWDGSNPNP